MSTKTHTLETSADSFSADRDFVLKAAPKPLFNLLHYFNIYVITPHIFSVESSKHEQIIQHIGTYVETIIY
jgi:hypothetical protein